MIETTLEEQIMREIDAVGRLSKVAPVNLSSPGGILGTLSQTKVKYDPYELAASGTADPPSLLDNLNHIRAGTSLGDGVILPRHLASGIIFSGLGSMSIEATGGTPHYDDITLLRFTNLNVSLISSNAVEVTGTTVSGYKSVDWFFDGTAAPATLPLVYKTPDPFKPTQITVICQTTASGGDLSASLNYSSDAVSWSNLCTMTLLAGEYTRTTTITHADLPSDTYLSVVVDSVPAYEFRNVSFILSGLAAGGGGGGIITSGGGGHNIMYSGVSLPTETNLNFTGPGVHVDDSPGTNSTVVTITGGAAVNPYYDPDKIPASPSVYDDEFNDDVIDGKWTNNAIGDTIDLLSASSDKYATEALHHGYLTFKGDFNWDGSDFYQTFAPADDNWTIVAKILPGFSWQSNGSVIVGVSGAAPTNYYQVRIGTSDATNIGVDVNYNDGGGDLDVGQKIYPASPYVYVLITKTEADGFINYYAAVSTNGISWSVLDLDRAMTTLGTAALSALYFGSFGGGSYPIYAIDWIRYWPEAGKFDIGGNV